MRFEIPADIAEVTEAFDCEVLLDLSGDDDEPGHAVVALGWHREPAAGLRGGRLTPYFDTTAELWAYVRENRETLLAKADVE
jgi:hypothetical protein